MLKYGERVECIKDNRMNKLAPRYTKSMNTIDFNYLLSCANSIMVMCLQKELANRTLCIVIEEENSNEQTTKSNNKQHCACR